MFYVPDMLRLVQRGNLPRCYLAATLSELLFKRTIIKQKIVDVNISESCEEIMRLVDNDNPGYTVRFVFHLASQLFVGILKLHDRQIDLFERDLLEVIQDLSAVKLTEAKKNKDKRPTIKNIMDMYIDEGLSPDPSLQLNRPFPPDLNRLNELSPMTYRKMRELEESNLLPIPALTSQEIRCFVTSDEEAVWPGLDTFQFPELEPQPAVFVDPAAAIAAPPDLSIRAFETPQKRAPSPTNAESPSKRLRKSLRPEMDAAIDARAEDDVRNAIPMEQNDEPVPLLIDPVNTMAPVDTTAVDHEAPVDVAAVEPQPPVDVAAVEPQAPVDVAAVEPQPPVDVAAVEPQTPVDVAAVERQAPVDPPEDSTVLPIDRTTSATMPPPRILRQKRRGRRIDAITNIPQVQLERRRTDVQRHCVSLLSTHARPERMAVLHTDQQPSMIFKNSMENLRYKRLRTFSADVLNRYANAIADSVYRHTDPIRNPALQIPDDRSTAIEPTTVVAKSLHHDTGGQPIEVNVEEHAELPEFEVTDDPAINTARGAQFQLPDIEETGPLENISNTKTVSIEKVQIFTDPPGNGAAIRHSDLPHSDEGDIDAFLPPSPKNRGKVKGSGYSKTPSSGDVIDDIESGVSSSRSAIPPQTSKDLLACLEVLWRDNNNAVSFAQLAPPELMDVDAVEPLFVLLLTLHGKGTVKLTQANTDAPLYIEKIVTSTSALTSDAVN